MTVTVVSTASNGGEVNEGRVGNAGGQCPNGWRERDGFFYYLERRRHLVGVGWGREDKLAGRGKFRDHPTNEHHGIILRLILPAIRYSTAQSPSYPSQTRSAMCPGSPSQDFSNHRVP